MLALAAGSRAHEDRGLPPAPGRCARAARRCAGWRPRGRPTSARVRRCSRSTDAGRSAGSTAPRSPGAGRPRRRARARPGRHQRVGIVVRSVPARRCPCSRTRRGASIRWWGSTSVTTAGAARAFAASRGATYPSLLDPEGTLLARLPMLPQSGVPSTLFLDRRGRVAARVVGPVDAHVLGQILLRLGGLVMTAPLTATAGRPDRPRPRDGSRRYVALTKPRIIELLLLTTLPVMFLARDGRARPVAGRRHAGRRHAVRRQRQRAQLRRRRATSTSGCGAPAGAAAPARGVTGVRARLRPASSESLSTAAARAAGQLAVGAARADRQRVLRRRLHDVAQAADLAEHRVGRRRRLLPGPDRLDGRARARWRGPRWCSSWWCSSGPRRTSGRWPCATARTTPPPGCRCCRSVAPTRDGRPADRGLRLRDGRDLAAALAGGRHRLVYPSPRAGPRALRGRRRAAAPGAPGTPTSSRRCSRCGSSTSRTPTWRCSSSRWPSSRSSDDGPGTCARGAATP